MLSHRLARLLGLSVLLVNALTLPSQAAEGPTLLKRTLSINIRRYLRYWPNPSAKEPQYNTYSWVPEVECEILGPVPGGSQFVAEFMKPDGKAWMTINMPTEEVGDDILARIKTPDADDKLEKKATIGIGTFPFRIRLKNELTGKNEVFFSGKYEVVKYPLPRVPAGDKNKTDFTTLEDWRVPIGFLWLNPADNNEETPPLSTQMWFRGAAEGAEMQAILFRDGQQVDATRGVARTSISTPSSENSTNWYFWQFTFPLVRGFNTSSSASSWPDTLFLDKSPGNYEIRVLRSGKLARTATFKVGEDGKIVDNGIATANKLGGIRMVLPVTVVGTADGALKAGAWKTHAFYANPLSGFTAPAGGAAPAPVKAGTPKTATPKTAGLKTVAVTEDAASDTAPVGGPAILKSTLIIRADRMQRYWKSPNTDNYWSWVPSGQFSVLGPVPTGTKFVVDFTKPDGSLWTSVDCLCPAAGENEVRGVSIAGASGHMDKRGITGVGTFGFKIRMVNEALGTKANMMSGKFTVAKFHKGNTLPAFKNQFEYYVNHDWLMPISYLWSDWVREPLAPPLHVNMWIKSSSSDSSKVAAYVFYNGKQIGSTKEGGSAGTTSYILTNGSDANDPTWYLWDFTFYSVRGWNTDTSGNRYDAHILAANPGEYEIRVLFNGALIRVAKFSVGDDGKIVDNGIATKNKVGGIAMILPTKVQGTADGKWDPLAWKTTAFYGNPLQGFTAP